MASKQVYSFGGRKVDGHGGLRNLLGGKGANLAEMSRLGLPVPAGFTITTEVCTAYYNKNKTFNASLKKEVKAALNRIEKLMGAKFGSSENPLLVSCRSGARVSMPGMMDTVLNIGLNDETVKGLISKTQNPRFAYDSYRRFVAMYGDVVLGMKPDSEKDTDPFDLIIDEVKKNKGYKVDTELTVEDLKGLVKSFKSLIHKKLKVPFPEEPEEQLWGAIGAVFESWMIPRAIAYRHLNDIPENWGTAVNVQSMVFGNMGSNSATGVAFSRDPATGENYFYGEYLINAQGEDVVAGIRTPNPINRTKPLPAGAVSTLSDDMPEVYKELDRIRLKLEKHYRDMQDIEFTIQEGHLWMLQCRNGKRTAQAGLRIAVELVREGLITPLEAILRVEPEQLGQLLMPNFNLKDPNYKKRNIIAKGLPASPGAAIGQAVFSATEAAERATKGDKVILVRQETSPEDIKGMHAAQGILTARGGMTSHAAVVARGMGRTCVAGASDIAVDYQKGLFTTTNGDTVKSGDWISLDGTKGEIIKGALTTSKVELNEDYYTFMDWVKSAQTIAVRTNADTPYDAGVAREYGAEGIGLCRTEHMFFESDRIDHIRAMILANDKEGRQKALDRLLPMQRDDFYGIFKAMNGLPVTIRTLDPPLHEFLPHDDREINDLAKKFDLKSSDIKAKIENLKEQNPMLGLRGCRLGIVFPEITTMQVRAIFEAATKAVRDKITVFPEIMIPLVGHEREFILQKAIVDQVATEVFAKTKTVVNYQVGTMIELPRAALVADRIAEAGAEFFSFGTNDLTQTTFGLSRDDSGKFLPEYLTEGIWEKDPFVSIDQSGVGQLITLALEKARKVNSKLKVGICGEHGGDPQSVTFCYKSSFNYVSCSPPRVPVARLAAAQAAVLSKPGFKRQSKKATNPKVAAKNKTLASLRAKAVNTKTRAAVLKTEAIKALASAKRRMRPNLLKTGAKGLKNPAPRRGRPPKKHD